MRFAIRYWWFWIALFSCVTYFPSLDNFFAWDDFLWLYRAKTIWANPAQIFKSEGLYFDPLVYLSFWSNYNLFGLDYKWYHLLDLVIHTANSLLVFAFVRLYSRNDIAALSSGLIFATAFAGSDAVFWSSARVDLLSTLFSFMAVIFFLQYLRKGGNYLYVASIVFYIAALGAKGTPVVIPALLLWLSIKEGIAIRRRFIILTPYLLITLGYFFLLWYATGGGSFIVRSNLNFYSYSLALASLFIPEMVLVKLNLAYVLPVIYSVLIVFCFIRFSPQDNRIKSIGLFMTFIFSAPVLILGDFSLPSMENPTHLLLGAPSHRIYLASAGMAIFLSSIFVLLYEHTASMKEVLKNAIAPIVLLAILGLNIYGTWKREKIWDIGTKEIRDFLYNMKGSRLHIPDGSVVVLINSPMSIGFMEPMLKTYYDINNVTIIRPNYFPTKLSEVLFIKGDILIVRGTTSVYDLSDHFNKLLVIAAEYQKHEDSNDSEKYRREYIESVMKLNQIIFRLMAKS